MKKSTRKPVLAHHVSVGLDLGSESAAACVIGRDGKVLARQEFALTSESLREVFGGEPVVVLLEATTPAAWVARALEELGHEVLVCNPRNLKLIAASTLKTDELDAEILGRLARMHQFDPEVVGTCRVRTRETQLRRSRMNARDQFVRSRTALVSLVRSTLKADAWPRLKCEGERLPAKVRDMGLPSDILEVLAPMLSMIEELNRQIAVMDRQIAEITGADEVAGRWKEIDGVGSLVSLSFSTTIEDPQRFKNARDVGPYLGVTPSVRQSSETEHRGKCTKRGDDRTRRLLVQAALCIMRSKKDSALKQWALQVARRRGRKKAVVALARKLAVVMMKMWLTGERYQRFPEPRLASAA